MGTRTKNRRWGLVEDKNWPGRYTYTDPLRPERRVRITKGHRWDGPDPYAFVSQVHPVIDPGRWVHGYEVYLKARKPTIHWVAGDLLDAMAVAASIIHARRGVPYRSGHEEQRRV